MEGRSYKTTFIIAKIGEILAWIIIVSGVLIGLSLIFKGDVTYGLVSMSIICITGVFLVYLAQLTLIFIDTENNTRQIMFEIQKTNSMLAETLGSMANNLNELAKKGE